MAVQKQRDETPSECRKKLNGEMSRRSKYANVVIVISKFCRETSVHGLGQVAQNTVVIAKVVWLVAFFAAVIGNAYHVSSLVRLYLEYPMQEVTRSQYGPITFPDVTVCNLNPISTSNFQMVSRNRSSQLFQYLNRVDEMYKSNSLTHPERDQYLTLTAIQINIGKEESIAIGHQLHNLVLRCTFKGQPCNVSTEFKPVMNSFLYNCYTFDPGIASDHFLATGAENGLSLILYLEADNGTEINSQYDASLKSGNALGLKVMIHPRHSYPIPHIDGIDVMPGHSTSIAFKVTHTIKLSFPYGDCSHNKTVSEMKHYEYTTSLCADVCLQRRFIDTCGCKSVNRPKLDCENDKPYCGMLSKDEDFQT